MIKKIPAFLGAGIFFIAFRLHCRCSHRHNNYIHIWDFRIHHKGGSLARNYNFQTFFEFKIDIGLRYFFFLGAAFLAGFLTAF